MRAARALLPLLALAFLASPIALAQSVEGVGDGIAPETDDPLKQAPPRDAPETGAPPEVDANLDVKPGGVLGFLVDNMALSIGITIGLGILGSLAFRGGTKFVNADNVLDNEARRSIFEHIQSHPGVHLRATAAALNLSTTNVLWHLRKLEEANLVSSKKFEGYKVFYPVAGGLESKRRAIALAVLRNDNAYDILQYTLSNPSAHQREIARALGVNHGTIRWHLRKLNEAGLILQVKKEHTSQYYVSELGVQLLEERAGRRAAPTLAEMQAMSAAQAAQPAQAIPLGFVANPTGISSEEEPPQA